MVAASEVKLLDPIESDPYHPWRTCVVWRHLLISCCINCFFAGIMSYFPTKGQPTVHAVGGIAGSLGWGMLFAAFFGGIFSPLFGSYSLKKSVLHKHIRPLHPDQLNEQWGAFIITQQGVCTRTALLCLFSTVCMGAPAIGLISVICVIMGKSPGSSNGSCSVPTGAFLAIDLFWTVIIQFPIYHLNMSACRNSAFLPPDYEETRPDNSRDCSPPV